LERGGVLRRRAARLAALHAARGVQRPGGAAGVIVGQSCRHSALAPGAVGRAHLEAPAGPDRRTRTRAGSEPSVESVSRRARGGIRSRIENMSSKIVQEIEKGRMSREVPDFKPGDTVVVQVKVIEGDRERVQAYEGVVIAISNRGLNSSFTVRKISHGEGVERVFQTYSPSISEISIK